MKSGFFIQIFSIAFAGVALAQSTHADQGHMERALNALFNARNQLSQASHDKGGHRANAIQLINRAIEQVRQGVRVGESHGD